MYKFYEQFKTASKQINIPLNRIERSYRTIKKYFGAILYGVVIKRFLVRRECGWVGL